MYTRELTQNNQFLPSAPGPVEVENVTVKDDTLTVWWNSPLYPNGILIGYVVSVVMYQGDEVVLGPEDVNDNTTLRHELNGVTSLGELQEELG